VSRDDAARRLEVVARQRGEGLLALASHAALPVVLSPDLVHLLRINYFLDPPLAVPYTAEAQLLLSPLCTEAGDDLYVMDPGVRDLLLQRLVREHGGSRLRDVARLLWEYGQRGTPWLERPGLAEAQQLTALNFIDPQRARSWLQRAEAGEGAGAIAERWFVAMRQDLTARAAAVEEAETQAVYLPEKLPALAELRDALAELYPHTAAVLRLAREIGVEVSSIAGQARPADRWQRLLEAAWVVNRVQGLLEAAARDHPTNPALARAIQEYWMRVTPVLRIEQGRFEPPPPEWQVLESFRAHIEQTLRSMVLLRVVGDSKLHWSGLAFVVGDGAIVAHHSMARDLAESQEGRWRLRSRIKVYVEPADRYGVWPEVGTTPPPGLLVELTQLEIDEASGLAVLGVAPGERRRLPPALRAATRPPADLEGRRVYLFGYPMRDPRNDPAVLDRMLGGLYGALRLHVGQVVSVTDRPPRTITHNCFTSGGTGGAPLIDLESGEVLGLHAGSHYAPGPRGLKAGTAVALWPLADHPMLAEAGVFAGAARPSTQDPPAPTAGLAARRASVLYRSADRETAERVQRVLLEAGVGHVDMSWVVTASVSNEGMTDLDAADFVVVLLTKAALATPWFQRRIRAVQESLAPIIPVLLEPDQIPPALNHVVYLELRRGDVAKNLAGLANAVRRLDAAVERHTYEATVSSYFNPPAAVRQIGRKLGGPSFAHLVAKLDPNEVLLGLYRNEAGAFVATHLSSHARMLEMEARFAPSEGYYAVDLQRANQGLDHKLAPRPGGAPSADPRALLLGERLPAPDEPAAPPVVTGDVYPLVGRDPHRRAFALMLERNSTERLLLLEGERGSGKTFLLHHFLRLATGFRRRALLLDLTRQPGPLDLIRGIEAGLDADLPREWRSLSLDRLARMLVDELVDPRRYGSAVLLLDGFDEAAPEVRSWLRRSFLPPVLDSPEPRWRVVIAGTDLGELGELDAGRGTIVVLRLAPLDQKAVAAWLTHVGLEPGPALAALAQHAGAKAGWQPRELEGVIAPLLRARNEPLA
jgi:hypothetical protein